MLKSIVLVLLLWFNHEIDCQIVKDSKTGAVWLSKSFLDVEEPTSQPTVSAQPSSCPTIIPSQQPSLTPSAQPSAHPLSQPSVVPSKQPVSVPTSMPSVCPSCQPSQIPTSQPSGIPSSSPTCPSSIPTNRPSSQPSLQPSLQPTTRPSCQPSSQPSISPSAQPSTQPNSWPSTQPSGQPSAQPSSCPSGQPSSAPSVFPTGRPTIQPTIQPTANPTMQPVTHPSVVPSMQPSSSPSLQPNSHPTGEPSAQPSKHPSSQPSSQPTSRPSLQPVGKPSMRPSSQPSTSPTLFPSHQPSAVPTIQPSSRPSMQPTGQPTGEPTGQPMAKPSGCPTIQPSSLPSSQPFALPSSRPSVQPAAFPTGKPSLQPSSSPSTQPSMRPSTQPTSVPSRLPSNQPSVQPSTKPTAQPSVCPSMQPSGVPSTQPTGSPTTQPSAQPTGVPSSQPSAVPTMQPTVSPTNQPSAQPTSQPSSFPTSQPSQQPTNQPTVSPTSQPSAMPSNQPSCQPTSSPSSQPSSRPSSQPSSSPSCQPSSQPSIQPSCQPSSRPSSQPSGQPSAQPSMLPTNQPTSRPSCQPTGVPSNQPTVSPSRQPTSQPTSEPSGQPSRVPSLQPTSQPTQQPISHPSAQPTNSPSCQPSRLPSQQPSKQPSVRPTSQPSGRPSSQPTRVPSNQPSRQPSQQPSSCPTTQPTSRPSTQPIGMPSRQPTRIPSCSPSAQPSAQPSNQPTKSPSSQPSTQPTSGPSVIPDCGDGQDYTFDGEGGSAVCHPCSNGYYNPTRAVSKCTESEPGWYAPAGSAASIKCPPNTYGLGVGNRNRCESCPSGSVSDAGSTRRSDCVNATSSFTISFLGLFACCLGIFLYIVGGRLHRISFVRNAIPVKNATKMCNNTTEKVMNYNDHLKAAKFAQQQTPTENKWKSLEILVAFGAMCLVFLICALAAFYHIFFNTVILYRGYVVFPELGLPPLFDRLKLFIDNLSFHIPFGSYVFYPFLWVYSYLSSIDINLSRAQVTCLGAQVPMHLLIDCFVVGIAVLVIESEMEVFWCVAFANTLQEYMKLLLQPEYWKGRYKENATMGMWCMALKVIPHPRSFLQFGLGFVQIGVFFYRRYSPNCNIGSFYKVDSTLANITSVLASFAVFPVVYTFALILVSEFRINKGIIKTEKRIVKMLKESDDFLVHSCKVCEVYMIRYCLDGNFECKNAGCQFKDKQYCSGVFFGCPTYKTCDYLICQGCRNEPRPTDAFELHDSETATDKLSLQRPLTPKTMASSSRSPTHQFSQSPTSIGGFSFDGFNAEESKKINQKSGRSGRSGRTINTSCRSPEKMSNHDMFWYVKFAQYMQHQKPNKPVRTRCAQIGKSIGIILSVDWFYLKHAFTFAKVLQPLVPSVNEQGEHVMSESIAKEKQHSVPWNQRKLAKDSKEVIAMEHAWAAFIADFPSYYRMVLTVQEDLMPKINHNVTCRTCSQPIIGDRYYNANDEVQPNICGKCVVFLKYDPDAKPTIHPDNNTWRLFFIRCLVIVFSWTIFGQLCSERGRHIWYQVLSNYKVFFTVAFGWWNRQEARDFNLDSRFQDLQKNDPVITQPRVNDPDYNDKPVHNRANEQDENLQMMSALVSPRIVLLQLIPYVTVFSSFAVDIANSPIFVRDEKLRAELPPLFHTAELEQNAKQLLLDSDIEPKPVTTFLTCCHLFVVRSRGIQFLKNGFSNIVAIVIVFSKSDEVLVVLALVTSIVIGLFSLFECLMTVVALLNTIFPSPRIVRSHSVDNSDDSFHLQLDIDKSPRIIGDDGDGESKTSDEMSEHKEDDDASDVDSKIKPRFELTTLIVDSESESNNSDENTEVPVSHGSNGLLSVNTTRKRVFFADDTPTMPAKSTELDVSGVSEVSTNSSEGQSEDNNSSCEVQPIEASKYPMETEPFSKSDILPTLDDLFGIVDKREESKSRRSSLSRFFSFNSDSSIGLNNSKTIKQTPDALKTPSKSPSKATFSGSNPLSYMNNQAGDSSNRSTELDSISPTHDSVYGSAVDANMYDNNEVTETIEQPPRKSSILDLLLTRSSNSLSTSNMPMTPVELRLSEANRSTSIRSMQRNNSATSSPLKNVEITNKSDYGIASINPIKKPKIASKDSSSTNQMKSDYSDSLRPTALPADELVDENPEASHIYKSVQQRIIDIEKKKKTVRSDLVAKNARTKRSNELRTMRLQRVQRLEQEKLDAIKVELTDLRCTKINNSNINNTKEEQINGDKK